jgi:hypothetical protein
MLDEEISRPTGSKSGGMSPSSIAPIPSIITDQRCFCAIQLYTVRTE